VFTDPPGLVGAAGDQERQVFTDPPGLVGAAGDGAEAGWKGPSRELRGPTPAGA
jgi:hypothetical protein